MPSKTSSHGPGWRREDRADIGGWRHHVLGELRDDVADARCDEFGIAAVDPAQELV
jgi:hypothetical protein